MAQTLVLGSVRRGIFKQISRTDWSLTACLAPRRRLTTARTPTLSPEKTAAPPETTDEVNDEPIKFSTSPGSHRTWRVERAMGSQHQRPWWKVLPVSLAAVSFLLWCVFREETEVDVMLQKDLYEHLPSLLPDQNQQPPGPLPDQNQQPPGPLQDQNQQPPGPLPVEDKPTPE